MTAANMPPPDELDFGIVTGQHWRSWETVLRQWRWAEETGWDSAWVFDHFWSLRPTNDGETLDGWTLLAALAVQTERLRMGTLVTGITHRYPAVLFKQAVTVDHISGGRLILGVGAAWEEREHEAYGLPFPPPGERVDMFGEALEINRLFETRERTTFEGEHYRIVDAPFEPKPVNGHIPVMIGSSGRRMLRHVARYADYWDSGQPPAAVPALAARVDEHCRALGREPGAIRKAISAYFAPSSNPNAPVVVWEDRPVADIERDFRAHVAAYAAVGVRTFLFNLPYDGPNEAAEHVARNVIPELRQAFAAGEIA
jgi:alkanesulfonate monooxygenase SsuD/methylene tetrahydromethanopterin reductase-like flavin-dependent oxidoreductase (luciferase family)